MKNILLSEKENRYKANLHCHTTVSDGRKTPQQVKDGYVSHGYSVVAYTDHNVLISHDELTDENFLALNGYEINVSEKYAPSGHSNKTCHICFISPKDDLTQVCYHRSKYVSKGDEEYRKVIKFDESRPDFEREYSANGVNAMIREAIDNGCFVTYNHPTWSVESYPEYSGYCGMDAVEIINYGCLVEGYIDTNDHCYDDLLRQGKRVFCIATDDNHNKHPDTSPSCDSYGGYTVILSQKLEYSEIMNSLKSGNFYCSTGNAVHCGPEILKLSFEDGLVEIETSNARAISLITNLRYCKQANAPFGETITKASFKIEKDIEWFRLTVTDEFGYKAYTNAYFISDMK